MRSREVPEPFMAKEALMIRENSLYEDIRSSIQVDDWDNSSYVVEMIKQFGMKPDFPVLLAYNNRVKCIKQLGDGGYLSLEDAKFIFIEAFSNCNIEIVKYFVDLGIFEQIKLNIEELLRRAYFTYSLSCPEGNRDNFLKFFRYLRTNNVTLPDNINKDIDGDISHIIDNMKNTRLY